MLCENSFKNMKGIHDQTQKHRLKVWIENF